MFKFFIQMKFSISKCYLKPEVLILDEITTGLDIRAQERILDFINDFVTKNLKKNDTRR